MYRTPPFRDSSGDDMNLPRRDEAAPSLLLPVWQFLGRLKVRLEPFSDLHLDIAVWRRLPIRHTIGCLARLKAVNGHRATLLRFTPLIDSIEQPP
jgi:hypothetical protein